MSKLLNTVFHHSKITLLAFIVFASLIATFITFLILQNQNTKYYENLRIDAKQYALLLENKIISSRVMGVVSQLGLTDFNFKKLAEVKYPLDQNTGHQIAHEVLIVIQEQFQADAVFIMNKTGIIVDYFTQRNKTSKGKNLHWRPYYVQAMQGKANIYAAVGSTSNKRGLYFAAPIYKNLSSKSEVIGVIVIKIKPTAVDQILSSFQGLAFLLSPQGIVYASNQQQWLYHTLNNLSDKQLEKIRALIINLSWRCFFAISNNRL